MKTTTAKITDTLDELGLVVNKRNCGVVAMAYVAKKSLDVVTSDFKILFDMPERWDGGTYHSERLLMLDFLDVAVKKVEMSGRKSLKTWMTKHADPSKTYIVTTTRHVQVVENGSLVIDQRGVKPVNEYWGRGKFIKNVLEVL